MPNKILQTETNVYNPNPISPYLEKLHSRFLPNHTPLSAKLSPQCILMETYLCGMNSKDDLQVRWWKLEEELMARFGKKPDVESLLFLIGIQELGDIKKKFSKEQKQDLMHIAICTVLSPSGFYELSNVDEEGWPHFKQLKPMPELNPFEQEIFLKDHILLYFQNNEL